MTLTIGTYLVSALGRTLLVSLVVEQDASIINVRAFTRQHRFTVIEYAEVMQLSRGYAHRYLAANPRGNDGPVVFATFADKFPERKITIPTGAW